MELNREQIIKALECCGSIINTCTQCPIDEKKKDDCECSTFLAQKVLSLIKELTEENERLKLADSIASVPVSEALRIINEYCESYIKKSNADTVRKMHSEIRERCIKGGIYPAFVARTIDQIAKEMMEGE